MVFVASFVFLRDVISTKVILLFCVISLSLAFSLCMSACKIVLDYVNCGFCFRCYGGCQAVYMVMVLYGSVIVWMKYYIAYEFELYGSVFLAVWIFNR